MSRTSQDIGKKFEKAVEAAFDELKRGYGFNYHKFVDTHAAGNVVASQPSDYLITIPAGLCYLEAKASTTLTKMGKSMLRPSQRRTIKFDAQVLGVPYYILFHSEKTGEVHLLNGAEVLRGERINYKESLIAAKPISEMGKLLKNSFQPLNLSALLTDYRNNYE